MSHGRAYGNGEWQVPASASMTNPDHPTHAKIREHELCDELSHCVLELMHERIGALRVLQAETIPSV